MLVINPQKNLNRIVRQTPSRSFFDAYAPRPFPQIDICLIGDGPAESTHLGVRGDVIPGEET